MKAKTINAIISGKIKAWTDHIDDPKVKDAVEKNTICTGGCIASMLLNEKVNDFDFYFRTREAAMIVASYYVEQFKKNPSPKFKGGDKTVQIYIDDKAEDRVKIVVKSAGIASEESTAQYEYFEARPDERGGEYVAEVLDQSEQEEAEPTPDDKPQYRPVFLSANAITLANGVQLVTRFYGEPEAIHANYDFVHVMNYWTSWDRKVVLKPEALEALLTKELRYVGSKYPLCSIIRVRKFIARGWTINAGQILKMAMNLQTFNLLDLAVLEEQLTGVDVAYFLDVIERLKAKDPTKVDGAYLIEIIDRMF